MLPKIKSYLHDILVSIDSIFDFVGNETSFDDYCNNKLLRRAVEREIEIIGEAMTKILKLEANIEIQNALQIVNTRNMVIHSYDAVDENVIWGIVKRHLPVLREEVEKLLK